MPSSPHPIKTGAWDPEEDELLYLWQSKVGNKWSEVARHIPGRTGQQCAQRWRHKVNPNIRRDKWTAEEDAHLISLVRTFGVGRWAEIARHCNGRTDQQCMGRWRRHLDPAIKRDSWTPEEDAKLSALHLQYGTSWSRISRLLKGRTSQQCRARWHQLHGGRGGVGCGRSVSGGGAGSGGGAADGATSRALATGSQRKRGGSTRRRRHRYSSSDEDECVGDSSDEQDAQDDSQATCSDQLPGAALRKQRGAHSFGLHHQYDQAELGHLQGEEGGEEEEDVPRIGGHEAQAAARRRAALLNQVAGQDEGRSACYRGDATGSESGCSDEESGGRGWGAGGSQRKPAGLRPGTGLLFGGGGAGAAAAAPSWHGAGGAGAGSGLPPTPSRGLLRRRGGGSSQGWGEAAGDGSGAGYELGTPTKRPMTEYRGGLGESLLMSPPQARARRRGSQQLQQQQSPGAGLLSSPDRKSRRGLVRQRELEQQQDEEEEEEEELAGTVPEDASEVVDEEEAAGAETLLQMASVFRTHSVEYEPCSVRSSRDFIAGTTPTKRPARCLPEMRLSDGLSPSPFKKPRSGRHPSGPLAWSAARGGRGGEGLDAGGQGGVDQDADICDLDREVCEAGLGCGDIASGGLDQAHGFGLEGGAGGGGSGMEPSHGGSSSLTAVAAGVAGSGSGAAGSGASLFLSPPRQMVPRWSSLDGTPNRPQGGSAGRSGAGAGFYCSTPVSGRDGAGSLSATTLAALQSPQTTGMNAIEPFMTPFTKMNGLCKGLTRGRGASATPELTGAKAKVGLPFASPPGCGQLFSPSRLFSPDSGSRGRATRSRLGAGSGAGAGGAGTASVQGPSSRSVSRQLLGWAQQQAQLGEPLAASAAAAEVAGATAGDGSPVDPVTAYSNQQRSRLVMLEAGEEGSGAASAAFADTMAHGGLSPSVQPRTGPSGTRGEGEVRLSQTAEGACAPEPERVSRERSVPAERYSRERSVPPERYSRERSVPPAGLHRVVRRLDQHEAWGIPAKQSSSSSSGGGSVPVDGSSCSGGQDGAGAKQQQQQQQQQQQVLMGADQGIQQQQQQGEDEEAVALLVPLFVGEQPKLAASPVPKASGAGSTAAAATASGSPAGTNLQRAALTRFLLSQQAVASSAGAGSPVATASLATADPSLLATPQGALLDGAAGTTPSSSNVKARAVGTAAAGRWALAGEETPSGSGAGQRRGDRESGELVTPLQQQPLQMLAPVAPLQRDCLAAGGGVVAATGVGRSRLSVAAAATDVPEVFPAATLPASSGAAVGAGVAAAEVGGGASGNAWAHLYTAQSSQLLSPDLLVAKSQLGGCGSSAAGGGKDSPVWTPDMVALLKGMQQTPLKPPASTEATQKAGAARVLLAGEGPGGQQGPSGVQQGVRRSRAGKSSTPQKRRQHPSNLQHQQQQQQQAQYPQPRLLHVSPVQQPEAAAPPAGVAAGSRPAAANRMTLPASIIHEAVSSAQLARPAGGLAAAAAQRAGSAPVLGSTRLDQRPCSLTSAATAAPVMLSSLQQPRGGWCLGAAADAGGAGGASAPMLTAASLEGYQQGSHVLEVPVVRLACGHGPAGPALAASAAAGPAGGAAGAPVVHIVPAPHGTTAGAAPAAAFVPSGAAAAAPAAAATHKTPAVTLAAGGSGAAGLAAVAAAAGGGGGAGSEPPSRLTSVESSGSDSSSNKENRGGDQGAKCTPLTAGATTTASLLELASREAAAAGAAPGAPAATVAAAAAAAAVGGLDGSLAAGLAGLLQAAGVAHLLAGVKPEPGAGLAGVPGMGIGGQRPGTSVAADACSSHHLRNQLHAMIDRL